jgi:hypothetical protein
MTHQKLLAAAAIVAAGLAVGCEGTSSPSPTAPSPLSAISADRSDGPASSETSPRSGALNVTKSCASYTFLAGSYCTITSSNLKAIEVGSKIVYAQAVDRTTLTLNSDVTLVPPGPGHSVAFGHVFLDLAAKSGVATFSGGTGKFSRFNARVDVTPQVGVYRSWYWNGTYSFRGNGDDEDTH